MSVPGINVILITPIGGYGYVPIGDLIAIDSAPEITEAIEGPAEVNRFVAPDVSLKINDDPKVPWVIPLFEQITPTSTDWYLTVDCDGYQRFSGYILPNTVQIDDTERWVSFTAIGLAGKLSTTSADLPSLRRPTNTGWLIVSTTAPSFNATLRINKASGAQYSCEFVTGDTLSITTPGGDSEEVVINWVAPVGTSAPYSAFEVGVVQLRQQFTTGAIVELATPYIRNAALRTIVNSLFTGAGLPATTNATYLVAPITGSSEPFASVPNQAGLIGSPIGIAGNPSTIFGFEGTRAVCGTTSAVYWQGDPPLGAWTYTAGDPTGAAAAPIDWMPQGTGQYLLYGKRTDQVYVAPDSMRYSFYAYDYRPTARPGTAYRYVLEITVDNLAELATTFNWDARVMREKSTDLYTWVADAGPWGSSSGATTTNIGDELNQTCGIDVSVAQGVVYWTVPTGLAGAPNYRVSSLIISSLTYTAIVVAGVRGSVFCPTYGVVGIFQRDTIRGNVPTAYFYTPTALGGLTVLSQAGISTDFIGETLRRNNGDGYWYALASGAETGVKLLSFTSYDLGVRAGWTPPQILAPFSPGDTVALTVIHALSWSGSGPFPMLAIAGNQLWWISFEFAGIIPYADMEGFSCGDALAQLATLVDAFFYVDRLGTTWFKSRSLASGQTIGTGRPITSTRIDDGGCLSLRRSGVWYKACRYVTIRNENDESIVGVAGDPAFIGNELALEITNRFVYPQSFAIALAQHLFAYLGGAITAVDAEHIDDGRDYSIGNSFTASVGGTLMTLQIIDTTHRPAAATVRVQGIEI